MVARSPSAATLVHSRTQDGQTPLPSTGGGSSRSSTRSGVPSGEPTVMNWARSNSGWAHSTW